MHTLNKLGIIGGAGPYASALLYQSLFQVYYQSGEKQAPEVMILNYPFTRGLSLEESAIHKRQLGMELQYCLDTLAKHGVCRFAIACNTLHTFLDKLDLKGMTLLSIPRLVIQTALRLQARQLLLLGTQTTIQSTLYRHPNLLIHSPLMHEQKLIDQVIDRLLEGKIEPADSRLLSHLVQQIHLKKPLDGVILGCTELPVLQAHHPLTIGSLALLDSIQIAAYNFIYERHL